MYYVVQAEKNISFNFSGDKPSKGGGKGDWSGIENLAGVLYELRDIKKDEELVCNALKMTDHAKLKINLTQPFDYEQMLTVNLCHVQ